MVNRQLAVLHFSNCVVRGGAEEHILTLLRGLNRQYFRLHLVCDPAIVELMRPDIPADVELISLSFNKPSDWASALRFSRILRNRAIDILHSHVFWSSMFASPVGYFCRVPVIVETPHIREAWRKGWRASFVIDRWVAKCVDRYIAVSEANARYLIQEKRIPATKVHTIRNGSNMRRYHPHQMAPKLEKTRLGFGEADPVLLVIGRLAPQKGHKVLIQAMAAVRKEFPQVRLICLGDGILKSELQEMTSSLGLQSAVRFVGRQNNVEEWLALSDISVLPSFYEGLPLSAIESLAAEIPVVATAVDGTPEIVVHGKTGLTVPPGDSQQLAQAICTLLRLPDLRRQFGTAGRKWVLQEFTEEQQIRQTESLYLKTYKQKVGSAAEMKLPAEVSTLSS